jgi:hypothetical protein
LSIVAYHSVGIRFPKNVVEDFKRNNVTIGFGFFDAASAFFGNCSLTTNVVSAAFSNDQIRPLDEPVVVWLKRNASLLSGKNLSFTDRIFLFESHII